MTKQSVKMVASAISRHEFDIFGFYRISRFLTRRMFTRFTRKDRSQVGSHIQSEEFPVRELKIIFQTVKHFQNNCESIQKSS